MEPLAPASWPAAASVSAVRRHCAVPVSAVRRVRPPCRRGAFALHHCAQHRGAFGLAAAAATVTTVRRWQRTLPNVLTAARVLMVLPIVVLFYTPGGPLGHRCCAVLFAVAALTDFLDGYLARCWQVQSAFGKFLDPVADKLLACAVLVLLPTSTTLPVLLVIPAVAITLREILVSALREWTALAGESALSQVGFLGKLKTATILVSLCCLLATCDEGLKSKVFSGALGLLYLGTILAYISSIEYIINSLPAFRPKS